MPEGTGSGKGFGKLILLGEHFVVYRVPALVAAVSASTACDVKLSRCDPDPACDPKAFPLVITDDRPAVPGYKTTKREEQEEATRLVLSHLGCTPREGYKAEITFGGDLPCTSGIGASAASCVALARAVGEAMGKQLTDTQVNEAGYEGEKGYHGTPSGIDNTASTYGGLLRFTRTEGDPDFEKIATAGGSTCRVVYASTGITASTTKVVGDVRSLRETRPEWFAGKVAEYETLFAAGARACAESDWAGLASAMDANHALLQELTVSCAELDTLVDAARAAGALGAKMSGTGRGGLIIALTPGGPEVQEKVKKALEGLAPFVWTAEIGG